MNLPIPEGKYVVAVSGGVDSMTLLDILAKQSLDLIVAHFNHGIRPDARKDEAIIRRAAKGFQLPYEIGYGQLGPHASEEQARDARYKFLNQIKKQHKANAIITAHHQDDLIETAILNILRGTGRRGLTAISANPDILRPLLHLPKKRIVAYAKKNSLAWQEDPTNKNEQYLRNYIRRRIIPSLTKHQRERLLRDLTKMTVINQTIDLEIANLLQKIVKQNSIQRSGFINLPTEVANEVLMLFLRQNGIRSFDKRAVERLTMAIKTAKAGSLHDVIEGTALKMTADKALLE